jgi:hypothetical protein
MEVLAAFDPGKGGGVSWRDAQGSFQALALPKVPKDLVRLIETINPTDSIIETVGGYIGDDEKSKGSRMFQFGYYAGAPYWILLTLGKRVRFVTPQRWQRALNLGARQHYGDKWKNHLKTVASDRFPSITVSLATADALLMLDAMLRQLI